jgi:ADP-L-glycero-D-manno-heptose 6-epimerase
VKLFRSTDPAFPDGGQQRDFVFVGDCVEHMLWHWNNPHPGGVFNSGTGTARTFLDLARAVFAALGREPVIEFIPMPPDLAKQYQNFTRAETAKLRAVGCDTPPTPLEAGVRETVEFLLKNHPEGRADAAPPARQAA